MIVGKKLPKHNKPWWNEECSTAYKDRRKRAWDRFSALPHRFEVLYGFKHLRKSVAQPTAPRVKGLLGKDMSAAFRAKFRPMKLWQVIDS
ncbi:hypothetical protein CEXT_45191 [Caerostris extrusa]|uniref:Uncharacterized protein n=1 Tax=Caerostris extrusa TaxID=172846 RepID=A0AAV4X9C1_CAEEX|nr:hypothetical protein CEXT_45191 [Caerostris extrusa]